MLIRAILLLTFATVFQMPGYAQSQPFDCKIKHCGLINDGSYNNLILGVVTQKASPEINQKILTWAKSQGWWQAIPSDGVQFTQHVLPVAITTRTPQGEVVVTTLMGVDEYDTLPFDEGDFVRYSPHGQKHNAPKADTPEAWAYWRLYGCIQVLCRKSDPACFSRYRSGVFRKVDGLEVDIRTSMPLSPGAQINTSTYLPLVTK